VRDVPSFPSAKGSVAGRGRYLGALFALVLAALAGALPARADEQASLANLLLAEQMVDVATTQQLLHSGGCAAPPPALNSGRFLVTRTVHCEIGSEADPLARPFVGSALTNAAIALALNGVLRFSVRGLGPVGTRALRFGVELYPAVLVGNVSSIFHVGRISTSVTLSFHRQ
jgi:hypothetical protein